VVISSQLDNIHTGVIKAVNSTKYIDIPSIPTKKWIKGKDISIFPIWLYRLNPVYSSIN
jgi:hypothetical protein